MNADTSVVRRLREDIVWLMLEVCSASTPEAVSRFRVNRRTVASRLARVVDSTARFEVIAARSGPLALTWLSASRLEASRSPIFRPLPSRVVAPTCSRSPTSLSFGPLLSRATTSSSIAVDRSSMLIGDRVSAAVMWAPSVMVGPSV